MTSIRTIANCHADAAKFRWQDYDPTAGTVAGSFTLDQQVATARAEMGEQRWAQLQAEWK